MVDFFIRGSSAPEILLSESQTSCELDTDKKIRFIAAYNGGSIGSYGVYHFCIIFLVAKALFATPYTAKALQPRSVLEIMSNGFYSGELGPSTIAAWCFATGGGVPAADWDPDTIVGCHHVTTQVGSAAFNLLIILAANLTCLIPGLLATS